MKKFKRVKELKQAQQKLGRRQEELKELMHADWLEIKEAAKWKNIWKRRSTSNRERKSDDRSWIDRLTDGATQFTRDLVRETEDRIESKVSEKMRSALNGFLAKKK